jgi:flagellar assembly protein FliH
MSEARKFLFDTEFPTVQRAGRTLEIDTDHFFDERDMEAAKSEAYAAGVAAGRAEAEQESARLEAQALEKLSRDYASLKAAHESTLHLFSREATALALQIGRTLAPKLIESAPLAEIEALVAACMSQIMGEARIVIRIHASLLEPLTDRVDQITKSLGFDGQAILLADDTVQSGDCRVEWADGGAERDVAALSAEIEGAIERLLKADDASSEAPTMAEESAAPIGDNAAATAASAS